ncbi:MAG: hypothetical protein COB69_06830 [Phycisphaera sp.]|nr:MAG: hypothetical protein COB69_06830 [Phycisphaera sp.]
MQESMERKKSLDLNGTMLVSSNQFCRIQTMKVGGEGDLPPKTTTNMPLSESGGAESGALGDDGHSLTRLVAAWPSLPEATRICVMALVSNPIQ